MNCTDPDKPVGNEAESDRHALCPNCAARAWVALVLRDDHTGETYHVFQCQCGNVIWKQK